MGDAELYCNKCRKPLTGHVWVTRCSHVFCDAEMDDISKGKKCPACKIDLPNMYDVVNSNLNPSEEFKSMVLAGLKPEIIFDIAMRSVSFWNYQMTQEKMYHITVSKQYEEHIKELETSFQTMKVKVKNDNELVERRIKSLKNDMDLQIKKTHELEGKLIEKNRQLNSIQSKYEALRRSAISTSLPKENKENQQCRYIEQPPFLRGYFDNKTQKVEQNTTGFSFNPFAADEKY